MAKALTINYNGKAYKAGYDRAAAKMFSRMASPRLMLRTSPLTR